MKNELTRQALIERQVESPLLQTRHALACVLQRAIGRVVFALLLSARLAEPALGQTTDRINATLQFNFSNPGARSLALGGAFTARADDATSAYANPAGLTQLFRSEVSMEFRGWSYSSSFLDGGSGFADGPGGLEFSRTNDEVAGLSFVSGLYPSRKGRWVVGVFGHSSADFETVVETAGVGEPGSDPSVRPLSGRYRLSIEGAGVSAAYRFGEHFSFGATLTHSRFALESRTERLNKLRADLVPMAPESLAPGSAPCCEFGNDWRDVRNFQTQTTRPGDDTDLTFTIGAMWDSPRESKGVSLISVGAFYRQGAEFGFIADSFILLATDKFKTKFDGPSSPENCSNPELPGCTAPFKVPDVFGIGLSARPSINWVISLDVNRVAYADLTDPIIEIVGESDSGLLQGEVGSPENFRIDDGTEFRLGLEYAIVRERKLPDIFLRFGSWLDPDHKLRYTGSSAANQALWAPGNDELHVSGGVGLRFRQLQIDLGVDVSDTVETLALSGVYYVREH